MKFIGTFRVLRERCGCIPQRYVLAFMAFMGVVIAYILRTCINMTILKMSPDQTQCQPVSSNETLITSDEICLSNMRQWSQTTKGQILGSFYYGYVLAHLPGAYLSRKYGGKHILGFSLLLMSIFSMLSPSSACYSSKALIATRIAMGVAEGPTFPALSELLSQWSLPNERTMMASVVFAGIQIGTVISMGVTGYMLEHMDWRQVFYIMGCVGILWFFLWTLMCYNKPSEHPFISTKEFNFLKENIPEAYNEMSTPWRALLKSKPVWALTIAEIGHDYCLFTLISELPTLYFDLTNCSYAENGNLSGVPFLLMWLSSVLLAYLCDKLLAYKCTRVTPLRRTLATIGAVVPGIGMVGASFVTDKVQLVTLVIVSMAFMGCCYCSLRVNPLDLSPNHAATLMAIANGAGATAGFITSTVVGALLKETSCSSTFEYRADRRKDWQNVFWIMFTVLVLTNLPFMVYGSGDVQPWDKPDEAPTNSNIRRRSTISGGEPIREKYKNYYPEHMSIKE